MLSGEPRLVEINVNFDSAAAFRNDLWYRPLQNSIYHHQDPTAVGRQASLFMLALVGTIGPRRCPAHGDCFRAAILAGIAEAASGLPVEIEWLSVGPDSLTGSSLSPSSLAAGRFGDDFLQLLDNLFGVWEGQSLYNLSGSQRVSRFEYFWDEERYSDVKGFRSYGNIRRQQQDNGDVALRCLPEDIQTTLRYVVQRAEISLIHASSYLMAREAEREFAHH